VSGLTLFIIAGFRGEGIDGDYGGVINMYTDAQRISFYLDNIKTLFVNNYPMVLLISSISKFILHSGVAFVFISFALLGVLLKIRAIKVLSHFWLLSALIYYCHFFMLHEMTQIRAGVATGILLLSIPYIAERNFSKFILYVAVATLFHYTALVYLPLYFLNSKRIDVLGYAFILTIPVILFLMKFSFHPVFQLLGDNALTHRYFVYIDKYQMGLHKEHNPFNILILLHILLSVFFLFNIKKLSDKSPYMILFIKIYIIATAVFYLFSDLPTFACIQTTSCYCGSYCFVCFRSYGY